MQSSRSSALIRSFSHGLALLYSNFAPFLVYAFSKPYVGNGGAIGLTAFVTIAEVLVRRRRREKLTRSFAVSSAVVLFLGILNISFRNEMLFRLEPVSLNLLLFFFVGATFWSPPPLFQDFLPKELHGKTQYIRMCTWIWCLHFLIKALAYVWVAFRFSVEEILLLRTIAGNAATIGLVLLERLFRPYLLKHS